MKLTATAWSNSGKLLRANPTLYKLCKTAYIMCRLKLKGKPFSTFTAASESSQELLWQELKLIDESLKFGAKHQTKIFRSSKSLLPGSSLLFHDSSCSVCKPVRMARDTYLILFPAPLTTYMEHQLQKPSLVSRSKHTLLT